jgi:hypothetical protein
LKFFGAERMGNVFNGITQAMRVVISRVNAPLVSRTVMWEEFYPISYRVLFTLL